MNCYYHPQEPAVAQCVDCHKGLCQRCASKYEIPICDDCNNTMDFTIRKITRNLLLNGQEKRQSCKSKII